MAIFANFFMDTVSNTFYKMKKPYMLLNIYFNSIVFLNHEIWGIIHGVTQLTKYVTVVYLRSSVLYNKS